MGLFAHRLERQGSGLGRKRTGSSKMRSSTSVRDSPRRYVFPFAVETSSTGDAAARIKSSTVSVFAVCRRRQHPSQHDWRNYSTTPRKQPAPLQDATNAALARCHTGSGSFHWLMHVCESEATHAPPEPSESCISLMRQSESGTVFRDALPLRYPCPDRLGVLAFSVCTTNAGVRNVRVCAMVVSASPASGASIGTASITREAAHAAHQPLANQPLADLPLHGLRLHHHHKFFRWPRSRRAFLAYPQPGPR